MSFCRDAALMSMRKVIKDKSPEEIKLLSKNDLEKPVTMDDFNEGNFLRGIVNCQGVQLDLFSSSVRLTWTTVSITICFTSTGILFFYKTSLPSMVFIEKISFF